jgi:hypothetical protein
MRAPNSGQKLMVRPQRAVKPLHTASDRPMIETRLIRSATQAMGRARVE